MAEIDEVLAQLKRIANVMEKNARGGSAEDRTSQRRSMATYEQDEERRRKMLAVERELATTQEEKFEAELAMMDESIAAQEKKLRSLNVETTAYKDLYREIERAKKQKREYIRLQNEANKQIEAGAGKAQQLGKEFLSVGSELNAITRVLPLSVRELKGFTVELGKSVVTGKLFSQVFAKIASNSLSFALSLDKQLAGFKRTTGAGNEYNKVIEGTATRYLAYGLNAQDASAAAADLFENFRDFTTLSGAEKESIATTTALLGKFGVSGKTSADILNTATKSLGMNAAEAEQMMLSIAPLAEAVGKPVTEIAGDLASAAPKLAFYGANMINVFKELEAQSKATGLSVDTLLGLVGEKFDTFESAGMAVGKLNALLGGPYLNSIDMLNASEEERLEMIQQSMDSAGVVFDDLNKFEQKAFASAIGTDVDTLRKSLNDLSPSAQLHAMQQEQLAKKAGEARDVMTKLTDSINSLIVKLGPAIEKVSKFLDTMGDWLVANSGLAKTIGIVTGLGVLLFKTFFGIRSLMAIGRQTAAINSLAASYAHLATAQAAAAATGGGGAEADFFRRGGPGAGGGAGTAGRAGRMAGLGRLARFGGAAAGIAAVGGLATNYGSKKLAESGNKQGAQALSIAGMAATGAATGAMLGGPAGAALGLALGTGVGLYQAQKIEDGIVTRNASGDVTVTPIDNKDNIFATKPGGALAKMGLLGGMGAMMGPMGMLAAGGGMMIQKMIVKPIVDAIAESGNTEVVVKIGEQELNKQIITALNSPQGRAAVSPFYQG